MRILSTIFAIFLLAANSWGAETRKTDSRSAMKERKGFELVDMGIAAMGKDPERANIVKAREYFRSVLTFPKGACGPRSEAQYFLVLFAYRNFISLEQKLEDEILYSYISKKVTEEAYSLRWYLAIVNMLSKRDGVRPDIRARMENLAAAIAKEIEAQEK